MSEEHPEIGRRTRVLVLFGGQSAEHDVSLRSAQTVIAALDPDRYDVVPVGITRDGQWLTAGDPMTRLSAASPLFAISAGAEPGAVDASDEDGARSGGAIPAVLSGDVDVVFPIMHGPLGEDGAVQGMLELAGLPYVGSGVLGSAVAMDKAIAKAIFEREGIPQVDWLLVQRRDWERDPEAAGAHIVEKLGFPCFVKPANMGSSVGVGKANDRIELTECMEIAGRYDRRIVIEQGVDARELEISVLGNDTPIASVAGEVVSSNEFYDYAAKYVDNRSSFHVPAEIDAATLAEIQDIAVRAFRVLDLAGMARIDFFLERSSGRLFLNEVNTIPGFTATSMYPMLWEASGLPIRELVDRLIALAIERAGERR